MGSKRRDGNHSHLSEISGELWCLSCKIRGLGELVRNQNGEPSLRQSEANLGVGEIMISIADELDQLHIDSKT